MFVKTVETVTIDCAPKRPLNQNVEDFWKKTAEITSYLAWYAYPVVGDTVTVERSMISKFIRGLPGHSSTTKLGFLAAMLSHVHRKEESHRYMDSYFLLRRILEANMLRNRVPRIKYMRSMVEFKQEIARRQQRDAERALQQPKVEESFGFTHDLVEKSQYSKTNIREVYTWESIYEWLAMVVADKSDSLLTTIHDLQIEHRLAVQEEKTMTSIKMDKNAVATLLARGVDPSVYIAMLADALDPNPVYPQLHVRGFYKGMTLITGQRIHCVFAAMDLLLDFTGRRMGLHELYKHHTYRGIPILAGYATESFAIALCKYMGWSYYHMKEDGSATMIKGRLHSGIFCFNGHAQPIILPTEKGVDVEEKFSSAFTLYLDTYFKNKEITKKQKKANKELYKKPVYTQDNILLLRYEKKLVNGGRTAKELKILIRAKVNGIFERNTAASDDESKKNLVIMCNTHVGLNIRQCAYEYFCEADRNISQKDLFMMVPHLLNDPQVTAENVLKYSVRYALKGQHYDNLVEIGQKVKINGELVPIVMHENIVKRSGESPTSTYIDDEGECCYANEKIIDIDDTTPNKTVNIKVGVASKNSSTNTCDNEKKEVGVHAEEAVEQVKSKHVVFEVKEQAPVGILKKQNTRVEEDKDEKTKPKHVVFETKDHAPVEVTKKRGDSATKKKRTAPEYVRKDEIIGSTITEGFITSRIQDRLYNVENNGAYRTTKQANNPLQDRVANPGEFSNDRLERKVTRSKGSVSHKAIDAVNRIMGIDDTQLFHFTKVLDHTENGSHPSNRLISDVNQASIDNRAIKALVGQFRHLRADRLIIIDVGSKSQTFFRLFSIYAAGLRAALGADIGIHLIASKPTISAQDDIYLQEHRTPWDGGIDGAVSTYLVEEKLWQQVYEEHRAMFPMSLIVVRHMDTIYYYDEILSDQKTIHYGSYISYNHSHGYIDLIGEGKAQWLAKKILVEVNGNPTAYTHENVKQCRYDVNVVEVKEEYYAYRQFISIGALTWAPEKSYGDDMRINYKSLLVAIRHKMVKESLATSASLTAILKECTPTEAYIITKYAEQITRRAKIVAELKLMTGWQRFTTLFKLFLEENAALVTTQLALTLSSFIHIYALIPLVITTPILLYRLRSFLLYYSYDKTDWLSFVGVAHQSPLIKAINNDEKVFGSTIDIFWKHEKVVMAYRRDKRLEERLSFIPKNVSIPYNEAVYLVKNIQPTEIDYVTFLENPAVTRVIVNWPNLVAINELRIPAFVPRVDGVHTGPRYTKLYKGTPKKLYNYMVALDNPLNLIHAVTNRAFGAKVRPNEKIFAVYKKWFTEVEAPRYDWDFSKTGIIAADDWLNEKKQKWSKDKVELYRESIAQFMQPVMYEEYFPYASKPLVTVSVKKEMNNVWDNLVDPQFAGADARPRLIGALEKKFCFINWLQSMLLRHFKKYHPSGAFCYKTKDYELEEFMDSISGDEVLLTDDQSAYDSTQWYDMMRLHSKNMWRPAIAYLSTQFDWWTEQHSKIVYRLTTRCKFLLDVRYKNRQIMMIHTRGLVNSGVGFDTTLGNTDRKVSVQRFIAYVAGIRIRSIGGGDDGANIVHANDVDKFEQAYETIFVSKNDNVTHGLGMISKRLIKQFGSDARLDFYSMTTFKGSMGHVVVKDIRRLFLNNLVYTGHSREFIENPVNHLIAISAGALLTFSRVPGMMWMLPQLERAMEYTSAAVMRRRAMEETYLKVNMSVLITNKMQADVDLIDELLRFFSWKYGVNGDRRSMQAFYLNLSHMAMGNEHSVDLSFDEPYFGAVLDDTLPFSNYIYMDSKKAKKKAKKTAARENIRKMLKTSKLKRKLSNLDKKANWLSDHHRAEFEYALGLLAPEEKLCTRVPQPLPVPTSVATSSGLYTAQVNASGYALFFLNPYGTNLVTYSTTGITSDATALVANGSYISSVMTGTNIRTFRVVSACLGASDLTAQLSKTGIFTIGAVPISQLNNGETGDTIRDSYWTEDIPSQATDGYKFGYYIPMDPSAAMFYQSGQNPNDYLVPVVYCSGFAANANISLKYHVNFEFIPAVNQTDLLATDLPKIGTHEGSLMKLGKINEFASAHGSNIMQGLTNMVKKVDFANLLPRPIKLIKDIIVGNRPDYIHIKR